jgi:hypothetical protein
MIDCVDSLTVDPNIIAATLIFDNRTSEYGSLELHGTTILRRCLISKL